MPDPVRPAHGPHPAPFTRLSGGLIPPFCPVTPSLAELMDPGVIGAAAKVKQDKAGAGQRIEAIKLLATVDCTYWPEAEEALIGPCGPTATSASGSRPPWPWAAGAAAPAR